LSYYGAGDYYGAGGFFSSIGGAIKGAVTGFLGGGPAGAVAGGVAGLVGGGGGGGGGPMRITKGGVTVTPAAFAPGGAPFVQVGRKKRRRMNYTNQKALTRANRRVDGFVRTVRKSLKHTNYKLVSKSAGTRKRSPRVIKESGSGDVILS